jgi:polysaccharide biosynthesis protein PslG
MLRNDPPLGGLGLRRFFPILALAMFVAGALPSSGAAQVPPVGSPDYGAALFPLGNPETTVRDFGLLTAAGFTWARVDVNWRSIEPSCKGCIDWSDLDRIVLAASQAGVKLMTRVDHPPTWARAVPALNGPPDDHYDYADFVSEMARRYAAGSPKGTIHAIQVWNEPNLSREWGGTGVEPIINRRQAVEYMSLLRQTYQLVKEKDPSKIIVSAGLSPTGTNDGTAQPDDVYLTWLYENDLQEYSDAIGMHAPGYGSAPEAELNSNPNFPHPSFYFRRVEQLRNIMVLNGDQGKKAWILEFGWTTDPVNSDRSFYAVTPELQADYLVRAFQYARANWGDASPAPWIGPMFVWNIADPRWTGRAPDGQPLAVADGGNEEYWWAITEPDGTPRPAYIAIQNARASGVLP